MIALGEAAALLCLSLSDHELAKFQSYYALLVDWNRRVNLTRITDPAEVAIRHFLDSLSCLLVLPDSLDGLGAIDVGAGAGFPGLPLKIVRPGLRLTLLDSVGKKTTFLCAVVAELGLRSVQVVTARAEELARLNEHREAYDIALARAVAPLGTLVEYCMPFVKVGGRAGRSEDGGRGRRARRSAGGDRDIGWQARRDA